jgi:hypothetical protein
MKPTTEQRNNMRKTAQEIAGIMTEYKPGQQWQYRWVKGVADHKWRDQDDRLEPGWDWLSFEYRRKPEPLLRKFKPEEVPQNAIVRYKHNKGYSWSAIVGVDEGNGGRIQLIQVDKIFYLTLDKALLEAEYTTDTGPDKTWHPFGVIQEPGSCL